MALGLALLIAGVGAAGSAVATHDDGDSYGTLVAEDPQDDPLAATPWLDLRELWFDEAGDALRITLVMEELTSEDRGEKYSVSFLNDREANEDLTDSNDDELECPGPDGSGSVVCEVTYHPPEGDAEHTEVPATVDLDEGILQAEIPAHVLALEPGDQLTDISAAAWLEVQAGDGVVAIGSDTTSADDPYVYDGEIPATPLGDLVIEDEAADPTPPITWLDLRNVWMLSDGERLHVTIEVADIHPQQQAEEYELRWVNDQTEPDDGLLGGLAEDHLDCQVGEVSLTERGCSYHYQNPDGEDEVSAVDTEISFGEDRIRATIPYELMHAQPGDTLEELEAFAWVDGEQATFSADTAQREGPYELG